MSILNRLNLLIRSNINDSFGGRGNGVRDALREMEASLRDAKRQQISLRQNEARLIQQIRALREEAEQWEQRAMLALKRNEEDLAREALIVKNKKVHEAHNLREQLDEHRAYMADIDKALEALEMKLESTRGRIKQLNQSGGTRASTTTPAHYSDTRDWDAEFRRRTGQSSNATPGGARSTSTGPTSTGRTPVADDDFNPFVNDEQFQEFDRMSGKINAFEAEIDAINELGDFDDLIDPRRAELERKFRQMEQKQEPRDDLSDLKKKFQ